MKKHYLVTGGAGFIGSHLCDALMASGASITVMDDLSTGHRHNVPDGVELIVGDCADKNLITSLIKKADGVFHLAAIASVQKSREEWSVTSHTNQFATIALLEAIQKSGRKIPFVYASSAAIYGDPDASAMPLKESTPIAPLTPYGADKAGCELHAKVARHVFGIPTLGLRFFNVYGPRQDPSSPYSGVISIFANRIPKGEAITIFGDGSQTRDFVYVADVVEHLMASMKRLHTGAVPNETALNVCTGTQTSVLQLAQVIADLSGKELKVNYGAAREGDILVSVGDTSAATQCLGVSATTALADGLKRIV